MHIRIVQSPKIKDGCMPLLTGDTKTHPSARSAAKVYTILLIHKFFYNKFCSFRMFFLILPYQNNKI